MGLHFGTLGLHLGTLVVHVGVLWALGCGPRPLEPLLWKMLQKGTQNRRRNRDIFHEFYSFCRKWQTAFGLRLCSRIRGGASRFHSLGHHWCPLFFQRFFDVLWGPKKVSAAEFGGRACNPLFDFKNNTLVYLYLLPSLVAFYMQPGELVPRAPFCGRCGRVFLHPGAYPMRSCLVVLVVGTCGCLQSTLQGHVVCLWHFGWP